MVSEPKKSDPPDMSSGRGPKVGSVLEGRYRITRILGEGGIGMVFEAEHIRLSRSVAIKVLQEQFAVASQMRERFDKEAKALAALSHPNIVAITDYGVARRTMPYLVMELLEGQSLREVIDSGGRMDEARAFEITKQILLGLQYAHKVGIIHRDLKPGNVFLVSDDSGVDTVKILDFGFVKILQDPDSTGRQLSRRGIPFGTVGYMPPEQLAGGETGPFSDVYAVGLLFYEMLTGHRPFSGSPVEVAQAHLSETIPPLSHFCPGLLPCPELEAFLEKALSKESEQRYADGAELLEALESLPQPLFKPREMATAATVPAISLDDVSEEIRKLKNKSVPRGGQRRSSVWLWIGGGALMLAIVVGIALSFTGTESDDRNIVPPMTVDSGFADSGLERVEQGDGDLREASVEASYSASDLSIDEPSVVDGSIDVGDVSPEDASSIATENPWERRPLPRFLANSRRRVLKGSVLGARAIRAVRRYARSNRDDPRPHLVLAQSYLNDGSSKAAIERYELAYSFDKAARGDPRMLADLLKLVEVDSVGDRATELVVTAYGGEAIGAVENALSKPRMYPKARRRLKAIRARLADE